MAETVRAGELVAFFKALSDENRLKIVALLSAGERSVEELADKLALTSPTVSHHLSRLSDVGIVSARAEGYYSIYRLEEAALTAHSLRLLNEATLPALAAGVETDAFDRKVLANCVDGEGRIRSFPAQRKKTRAILRYVARAFQPGRHYTEREINAILRRFSGDPARLRHHLVDFGFIERHAAGSDYWTGEAGER